MPERLLAKSRRFGREEITLQRHLFETEQSATRIFRLDGRWGKNWCHFFKLYEQASQEGFLLHVRIAALFHDIGKANEDFYEAVTRSGFFQQSVRHEHLSALILHLPYVRNWLRQNSSLDLEVITAAVLSHHIKAAASGDEFRWGQSHGKPSFRLFCKHSEIDSVLERIRVVAELPNGISLCESLWAAQSPWLEAWADGTRAAKTLMRDSKSNEPRRSLLLAVKAGVIVADAASSGLVREGHDIDKWIDQVVHSHPISSDEISTKILNPKKHELSKGDPDFDWHKFQKKTATLGERALLLAACGAGKTVAAWKWAEAQMNDHQIGKVVFLYPTRGTATEGFRDYVGWAPEAEGAYVAGDSRYVLEGMASNPSEATRGKHFELSEAEQRLFALGLWSRRFFSATVDQFLSFIEHGYTSLCLLPALADSAVIIDEVHSFDRHMFDNLISFLQTFDLPVLCMTATLPSSRRGELLKVGLRVYPNDEERIELEDLTKKEQHPRYKLEFTDDEASAMKIAADEFRAGKKRVLWVVNTVKRCQRIAYLLGQKPGSIKPLVYHSRFRLMDRKERHAEVVAAFRQFSAPKIAVTTQVCEMSLDLDADVLITEFAPVSSLVQRFGRANRHLIRGEAFRGRLVVYGPESCRPYTKADLDTAENFLGDLGTEDISQELLATKLEMHALAERTADGSARFLEGGYYATPGVFRDIEEFATPCILTSNLADVKSRLDTKRPFDEFVVNVPKKFAIHDERRPGWLPKFLAVADEKLYDPYCGFMPELEETEE